MAKQYTTIATACIVLSLGTCLAQTAAKPSTPAEQPTGFAQFINDAKHPVSWFDWGADFRARNEYYNEIVSLNQSDIYSEQDVVRFRGRLWATAEPVKDLTLNTRLSAEPRLWNKRAFATPYVGKTGMEWRYGIFDLLNVKWDKILDQPLTITAGRQDIMLGDFYDWWLVSDGTPNDGSWTFFLDSVRVTWEPEPLHTRFDLIYIQQSSRPDEWMPTIGDPVSPNYSDYYLTEQNERGAILYASNKSIKNTQIDGYFIYKHDSAEELRFAGTERWSGDNADIYTAGGKITGTPAEHWKYSLEGAYQFGQKEDRILGVETTRDIDAYGAKAKLTYLLKDQLNNQFSLSAEFLSGDDPNTQNDEMFDVLWGRWPRWSELYIYSYATETSGKFAQMNNLFRVGPSWSITPAKGLTFTAAYNALFAPEDTATRAVNTSVFSSDGNFRGHFAQAFVKYQINKYINAHLWGEAIWQGDYYENRDLLSFVRAEIMFTF